MTEEYYVIAYCANNFRSMNAFEWRLYTNLFHKIGAAKGRSTQLSYAYDSVVVSIDNAGYKDIYVKHNDEWQLLHERVDDKPLTLERIYYLAKKYYNEQLVNSLGGNDE